MDPVLTSQYPQPHSIISIIDGILSILFVVFGIYEGGKAFLRGYRKSSPKEKTPDPAIPPPAQDWELLCSRARQVVDGLISQLPLDLATEANQVPCLFRERAEEESPGYRTLGTYHNFIPGRKSDHNGPIFLYLKSIEENCIENNKDFEEEISRVYLHELGHHFGWDEVDLVRHGLPSGRPPGE